MRREQMEELGREAHRARIRRILILAVLLGGSAILFGGHTWRVQRLVREVNSSYERAQATPLGSEEHTRAVEEYRSLREQLVQVGHWQALTTDLPGFEPSLAMADRVRIHLEKAVPEARHTAFSIALTEEGPLLRATLFGPPHVLNRARIYLNRLREEMPEGPQPVETDLDPLPGIDTPDLSD
jgi:hypothetical protein